LVTPSYTSDSGQCDAEVFFIDVNTRLSEVLSPFRTSEPAFGALHSASIGTTTVLVLSTYAYGVTPSAILFI
jgi:hypothetical protein